MAKDYYNHNQEIDYIYKLNNNNKGLFPFGETKYEIYYSDILGFWR